MTELNYTIKDFKSENEVRWCPGCGDYAIMNAVQKTMAEMDIPHEKVCCYLRHWLFIPFPLLHEHLWLSYNPWTGCSSRIRR